MSLIIGILMMSVISRFGSALPTAVPNRTGVHAPVVASPLFGQAGSADKITLPGIEFLADDKQAHAGELAAEMHAGLEKGGVNGVTRFNRAKSELLDLLIDHRKEKAAPGSIPFVVIELPRPDFLEGKDLAGLDLTLTIIRNKELEPVSLKGANLEGIKTLMTIINKYYMDDRTRVSPGFSDNVEYRDSANFNIKNLDDISVIMDVIKRYTGESPRFGF